MTEPTTGNAPAPSSSVLAVDLNAPSGVLPTDPNGPPRPADPSDVVVLEFVSSRIVHRFQSLIQTEISTLESLLARTPHEASDRPLIMRRLAEDYVELETGAAGGTSTPVATHARSQAVKYYSLLINEYPGYPLLDEVFYFVGREYQREGDSAEARKAYFILIQKYPTSHCVPLAYLAFAEIFFDEAERDPSKWELAAQAYAQVTKYPPPDDRVYGYALYKLAHVYWREGDLTKVRDAFLKAIDFAAVFPTIPRATRLGEVARRDMGTLLKSSPPATAPL
jgi:hypothetical protein